jgi:hypothetical protein
MADNRLIELWNELRRRKVIRVAVVYVVSAWIAVEAASVIFPARGLGPDRLSGGSGPSLGF